MNVKFLEFCPVTATEIKTILSLMNKTTCALDPFPTSILVASDLWIDMLIYIVYLCITTGQFPNTLKSAVVKPLLKKPTLDPHIFKSYRPVSFPVPILAASDSIQALTLIIATFGFYLDFFIILFRFLYHI